MTRQQEKSSTTLTQDFPTNARNQMTMTTISHLPRDLLEEIFSRVPWKSMTEVRLTCRMWDSLSRSQSFANMHIEKTASATKKGESRMIMLMDDNLYLKSVVFDNDPSIESKGKLTCLDEQVNISQVFHCEGLLLCILKDDSTKIVVWNPYWGQTRWIETRYCHQTPYRDSMDWYVYALGYVKKKNRSFRSHKILRFTDDDLCLNQETGSNFLWYEIYDFDSDSWTTLNVVTPHWRIWPFEHGVTLKGNTYWCASERKPIGEYHIICFDFTRETFGPLLRLPFSAGGNDRVILSCVKEEKLAVSLQHAVTLPHEFEIWISTKIEADKVSWSKFLTMDMGPDFYDIPISSKNFFIDEEKKVAMGFYDNYVCSISNRVNFIGKDGYFRELDLGGRRVKRSMANLCPYVPSPVQIKKSAGCKRKKQSNLEKRRYGKKMLQARQNLEQDFRLYLN